MRLLVARTKVFSISKDISERNTDLQTDHVLQALYYKAMPKK